MNRSVLSKIFWFGVGASVGSFVTWKVMNETYKQAADQEIESMREYYHEKYEKNYKPLTFDHKILTEEEYAQIEDNDYVPLTDEDCIVVEDPTMLKECESKIDELGYKNYAEVTKPNKEEKNMSEPYVISPDEFGEYKDYKCTSLVYFSDGVLADYDYERIDDVDDLIGYDSLDHFGEYEDDSVFVRNDRLKTDYEVLLDARHYGEITGETPYVDPEENEEDEDDE